MLIRVVAIADFHGQLSRAATLAAAIAELRAGHDCVVVGVGDLVGWSQVESALTDDVFALEALHAMGVTLSTIGNHELDKGIPRFRQQAELAPFPYVAANVLAASTGDALFPGSVVRAVAGIKVGFIGALTTSTPGHVGPEKFRGVVLEDIAAAINREAERLGTEGVRVLIAAPHEGVRPTEPAAPGGPYAGPLHDAAKRIAPEVDLVLGGHVHHAAVYTVDDPAGVPRTVAQPGSHGTSVVVADLAIDESTGRVERADSSVRVQLVDPHGPRDAGVRHIVDRAYAEAARRGATVVGRVSGDIVRPRDDSGQPVGDRESPLDNLIADAQLAWVNAHVPGGADFAITSNWLTLGDLLHSWSGEITLLAAWYAQPRDPTLLVVRMTGAEIETMFRQQWPGDPPVPRPTLGVSHNVAYVRDPGRTTVAGGACAERFLVDGQPLNRRRTYRVVVNSILARGIQDYFPVFAGIGLDRRYDTGATARDALVEYLDRYAPGPDGLTGRMPSPADVVAGQFDLPDAGANPISGPT